MEYNAIGSNNSLKLLSGGSLTATPKTRLFSGIRIYFFGFSHSLYNQYAPKVCTVLGFTQESIKQKEHISKRIPEARISSIPLFKGQTLHGSAILNHVANLYSCDPSSTIHNFSYQALPQPYFCVATTRAHASASDSNFVSLSYRPLSLVTTLTGLPLRNLN